MGQLQDDCSRVEDISISKLIDFINFSINLVPDLILKGQEGCEFKRWFNHMFYFGCSNSPFIVNKMKADLQLVQVKKFSELRQQN